uniref:(California timema) hypothetical protein n=1 Tax=Timema californicum TaxID=61474 RepID=A0A7R9P3F7_TIMCA|nr:unnamed protein product [Timema californicum]
MRAELWAASSRQLVLGSCQLCIEMSPFSYGVPHAPRIIIANLILWFMFIYPLFTEEKEERLVINDPALSSVDDSNKAAVNLTPVNKEARENITFFPAVNEAHKVEGRERHNVKQILGVEAPLNRGNIIREALMSPYIKNCYSLPKYGDMGQPVVLPSDLPDNLRKIVENSWNNNVFNQYLSDLISVHRKLPDSTLVRTVRSVIDRSPSHLVKEVVLIDDFYDLPHTKLHLEEYMAKRTQTLIASWLEPLLDRIARSTTAVVCQYLWHKSSYINVGEFNWNIIFDWHAISKIDRENQTNPTEPVRSPTMTGGLFLIDMAFFKMIETYDNDFNIRGAGERYGCGEGLWRWFRVPTLVTSIGMTLLTVKAKTL